MHDVLETHGQSHVLRFWDELDEPQRRRLSGQVEAIDFDELSALIRGDDESIDFAALAAAATPPPAAQIDGGGVAWSIEAAREAGEAALAAGEVAAIVVAGGQGTRLGFDKPKGMFPIGPISRRTLFEFFADRLWATAKTYGETVPWYVMTSEATDAETREYFESKDYFGLERESVQIFRQGTLPAVDATTGKLLLASKDSLALSPDGHGGTVKAMHRSGALADATKRGVKYLNYIQVDNPLADLCDPTLIGHHILAASELTTQVVRKRYPMEKVGNVVRVDGGLRIIEYSDLPRAAAEATDAGGKLKLWAGNIAVHVFNVEFLTRMAGSSTALPFHRANKKVAHIDETGQTVRPDEPNALKFEKFIFDLLPRANNAFVVECSPADSFAPVKNAEGAATDTASLARRAIMDQHRGRLKRVGAELADGIRVEISDRFALNDQQLSAKIPAGSRIEADRYFDR